MSELAVLSSSAAYPDRRTRYRSISHGRGSYLYDSKGNRFFDAASGSGSLILGHGDTQLAAVLQAQATKLTVFPGRQFSSDVVERYVERLVAFAPNGIGRAVLYSSGSDAVEASIKLAIQYHLLAGHPKKTKILGRDASYHGNTLSGLAAGGFIRRQKPYERVLTATAKASSAYCLACQFDLMPTECKLECAASLEHAITSEDPDTVAAFLVEPIVGAALSAAVPDDRYFQAVRRICSRYNVLMIVDEVMTGFGRTGQPFAVQHWGVEPDIVVAGKGISAGYYPLSALLVHSRIASIFDEVNVPLQNSQTYACSPIACSVGAHVLDRIQSEHLIYNAMVRGAALIEGLRTCVSSPFVANIRGKGLMIGFDLRAGLIDPPTLTLADCFEKIAMSRGVLTYPSSGGPRCETGDHVLLLPPLNIDRSDVHFLLDALSAAFRDLDQASLSW